MPRKILDQVRIEHSIKDQKLYDESYTEVSLAQELARLVYELRTQAGLTQVELARRMGTTQSSVARWESGGSLPTFDLVNRLGQAVEVRLQLIAESPHAQQKEPPGAVTFGAP